MKKKYVIGTHLEPNSTFSSLLVESMNLTSPQKILMPKSKLTTVENNYLSKNKSFVTIDLEKSLTPSLNIRYFSDPIENNSVSVLNMSFSRNDLLTKQNITDELQKLGYTPMSIHHDFLLRTGVIKFF